MKKNVIFFVFVFLGCLSVQAQQKEKPYYVEVNPSRSSGGVSSTSSPDYGGLLQVFLDNLNKYAEIKCNQSIKASVDAAIAQERNKVNEPTRYVMGVNFKTCTLAFLNPMPKDENYLYDVTTTRVYAFDIYPMLPPPGARLYIALFKDETQPPTENAITPAMAKEIREMIKNNQQDMPIKEVREIYEKYYSICKCYNNGKLVSYWVLSEDTEEQLRKRIETEVRIGGPLGCNKFEGGAIKKNPCK